MEAGASCFILFARYCEHCQIKEEEMGGVYSTHREE
jgi:hypothetical protein